MKLKVLAEVDGDRREAGIIETLSGKGERFEYTEEWLSRADAKPLSLSLPLSERQFEAKRMRPYFEGLLPEEDARKSIATELGISSNSYLKLLHALGNECIGAVMIIDDEGVLSDTLPHYEKLSEYKLKKILSKGYAGASKVLADTRLSIAGAQAKIGLYRSPEHSEAWCLPTGTAPSTHIVKLSNDRFAGIALNEYLCLSVARRCGLDVPSAFIIDARHPTIVIERYDRAFSEDAFSEDAVYADGLAMPSRLHQEDLCQALGILGEKKYETRSRQYLSDIAALLRTWSVNPIADLGKLWDILVFDYLIGNCDNHIKNLSLMRSRDWTTIQLAPCYDLVNTTIYDGLTHTMGILIGSTGDIDKITREDFGQLAEIMGVSKKTMFARLDDMAEKFTAALSFEADALAENWSSQAQAEEIGTLILADSERRIRRIAHR